MTKSQIIDEIRRTAALNKGTPLGSTAFSASTGIRYQDWHGVYWARWGDALREAGFSPNQFQTAYETDFLLQKLAALVLELGRLPTKGDLKLKRRSDSEFPSFTVFDRVGRKMELIRKLLEFCNDRSGLELVIPLCEDYLRSNSEESETQEDSDIDSQTAGYVYLLKHGSRKEYKIGRTFNNLRREGEIAIELPEKVKPIHTIETDDPAGVEAYWHRRFHAKRLQGEWFALDLEDVQSFKRWRRIM
jgi:hypothetical protein